MLFLAAWSTSSFPRNLNGWQSRKDYRYRVEIKMGMFLAIGYFLSFVCVAGVVDDSWVNLLEIGIDNISFPGCSILLL